jgi:hypothetical protein
MPQTAERECKVFQRIYDDAEHKRMNTKEKKENEDDFIKYIKENVRSFEDVLPNVLLQYTRLRIFWYNCQFVSPDVVNENLELLQNHKGWQDCTPENKKYMKSIMELRKAILATKWESDYANRAKLLCQLEALKRICDVNHVIKPTIETLMAFKIVRQWDLIADNTKRLDLFMYPKSRPPVCNEYKISERPRKRDARNTQEKDHVVIEWLDIQKAILESNSQSRNSNIYGCVYSAKPIERDVDDVARFSTTMNEAEHVVPVDWIKPTTSEPRLLPQNAEHDPVNIVIARHDINNSKSNKAINVTDTTDDDMYNLNSHLLLESTESKNARLQLLTRKISYMYLTYMTIMPRKYSSQIQEPLFMERLSSTVDSYESIVAILNLLVFGHGNAFVLYNNNDSFLLKENDVKELLVDRSCDCRSRAMQPIVDFIGNIQGQFNGTK